MIKDSSLRFSVRVLFGCLGFTHHMFGQYCEVADVRVTYVMSQMFSEIGRCVQSMTDYFVTRA